MNIEERFEKFEEFMRSIKKDKKYKNMSMEDKIVFIQLMRKIYENVDEVVIQNLTEEFILENISERGWNRLRKLKDYEFALRDKKMFVELQDDKKRLEMKEDWREKIFGERKKTVDL